MNEGEDISIRFAAQEDLDTIASIYAESFDDLQPHCRLNSICGRQAVGR